MLTGAWHSDTEQDLSQAWVACPPPISWHLVRCPSASLSSLCPGPQETPRLQCGPVLRASGWCFGPPHLLGCGMQCGMHPSWGADGTFSSLRGLQAALSLYRQSREFGEAPSGDGLFCIFQSECPKPSNHFQSDWTVNIQVSITSNRIVMQEVTFQPLVRWGN